MRQAPGASEARQGRKKHSRAIAENSRRSAVVPCAPTKGNRLFAKDAPNCKEAIAATKARTGKKVDGGVDDVLSLGMVRVGDPRRSEGVGIVAYKAYVRVTGFMSYIRVNIPGAQK
jgi:hypothetical protein